MTVMPSFAHTGHSASQPQTIKLAARKVLFDEGDEAVHVYEIVSGAVMTYKVLGDGRRQIFEILRSGDFVGFSHLQTYGHGAQTLAKCELRRSSQNSLLTVPSNQTRLLRYLVGHRNAHYAHALLLGRKSAAERIAIFFAEYSGTGRLEGEVHINLREMGDFLGLRQETVSRQVAQLCKLGLISRSRWGTYRVTNRPQLLLFANDMGANEADKATVMAD